MTKACRKCGEIKPLEEFWKRTRHGDELRDVCKACYRQENKLYRQTSDGKKAYKAAEKKYLQKHREEATTRAKKYYQEHKNEVLARIKEYRKSPNGRMVKIKSNHKRRAQKRGVIYEIFNPQEIFERDGWRCQHCHKKVQWYGKDSNHPLYPNLDHIVPLSKGGEHTKQNTQLLCRECNSKKHTNDVSEQLRLFG